MKKNVNGVLVEMTVDEIAEMEQMAREEAQMEPTPEERIAALEQELAAAKILLGLEE